MFSIDEELFTNASNKISNALEEIEDLKPVINTLNDYSFNCEFKGEIANIINNIILIEKELNNLVDNTSKTKTLIKLMDDPTLNIEKNFINNPLILKNLAKWGQLFISNTNIDILNSPGNLHDTSLYGADQSGAISLLERGNNDYDSLTEVEKKQYSDLMMVLEKYDFISKEGNWNQSMYDFMITSEQVGCGFAANTNIIIDMYLKMENGEARFYEKYGFPLYYTDSFGVKHYNYDTLFANHFLSSIDNFSKQVIPGVDIEIPTFWSKWNPSVINYFLEHSGGQTDFMTINSLKNEFPDMTMNSVEYSFISDIKPYISEYSNHNYTVVRAHEFTLTSMDGIETSYTGGHFMSVIGVTDDNKYIVSSWGESFILDVDDFLNLYFIDFGG